MSEMKQKEVKGKRFQYLPLEEVSLDEVKSRDARTQFAHVFVQKLKGAEGKVKKGIWICEEQPSYLVLEEKMGVVRPEELEEQVKRFAPELGSRIMTLEEAVLALEWIRQKIEVEVETLASIEGVKNSIVPYLTNRKNVLLAKTEEGYALLGSGEYFKDEFACTHVSYIQESEHIDKDIKPIMVLEK